MRHTLLYQALLGIALMVTSVSAWAQAWQVSSEDTTYWYRITPAQETLKSYAMTDASNTDGIAQLVMLATDDTEELSQWKITETSGSEDEKLYVITNRSTGMMIQARSVNIGNHNATQLTLDDENNMFNISEIADGAYRIQSTENDGVERALAIADCNGAALAWPTEGELATSPVAWKFVLVEEVITGLNEAAADTAIRIANHRISVKGAKDWQLFNVLGEEMPRTTDLPTGTYIVKVGNKTFKVVL